MKLDYQLPANDDMSLEEWLRIVRRVERARLRRLIRAVGLRRPMPAVETREVRRG